MLPGSACTNPLLVADRDGVIEFLFREAKAVGIEEEQNPIGAGFV
jgi:hypothetical protein